MSCRNPVAPCPSPCSPDKYQQNIFGNVNNYLLKYHLMGNNPEAKVIERLKDYKYLAEPKSEVGIYLHL